MKPLRLSLQAFGPFWNRAEVDFQTVHPQGLFLIHGPVGSGKTSLLDGICFSLYGVSSGGERSPQQLRCDLATDSTPTRVEFEFEAGGSGWKVERSLTTARLTPLETDQPVVEGIEAVEQRIHRLLGLDAFQFRRSVLLPQGQFRQFLLAPSGEREQILAALFHAHSPRLYQEALAKALSEGEEELRQAWNRREQLGPGSEALRQQSEHLKNLETQLERWKEQSARMQEDRERSAVVAERSRERQRVRQQLDHLREREADLSELQAQAQRMGAALKVAAQVEQWEQAKLDEKAAQDNFQEAELELQNRLDSLKPPEETVAKLESIQTEQSQLVSRLRDLERYENEGQRLQQGEDRLQRCRQTWHQIEEEGQIMERELDLAQKRVLEVQRFEVEEQALRQQLSQQQKQLEVLRDGHKLQRQQDELQQGLERVQQSLVNVAQRRNRILTHIDQLERDLHERTRQLEQHWAHSLAHQLKADQPCPVCGSSQHPNPAAAGGSPAQLSQEQLRKQLDIAWKQAEKIEEEEHEHQINLVRLEERLEAARDKARNTPVLSDAAAQVQQITVSLRDLERDLQRLQNYRQNQERDQRRVRKLQRKLEEWQQARAVAQQALTQAEAIVEERRQLVPDDVQDPHQEKERIRLQLDQLQKSLETHQVQFGQDTHLFASFAGAAEAARKSIQLSAQRTQLCLDLVNARLELNGFTSLEEWRQIHKLALHDLDSIQQELQSHHLQVERLETEVERAEQLYHESLEDWHELDVAPDQIEQNLQQCYAEVARAQEQIRQLERNVADYDRAVVEILHLEPRLAQLRRLARAAQGDNLLHITFQQWVLAQQMESVLQSANQRLSQMTRGRFTLESAGPTLQLEVLDHLSGQARGVSTLSGGESFLASLALALGLSDSFLQAGNNAVLETLFIDEGFGYLDEDGLDQAFWALEPIHKDGRIIGIVSHLAEVRQRIDKRLEVRPGPSGNQLIWNR
ncbi:SMC family ATPase [bacterium]|nr:SMC family ATPase [bacterium]